MNGPVNQTCPYCGAPLPGDAAFCPHCARSVLERRQVVPPSLRWKRPLHLGMAVLLLAAVVLSAYLYTRPRTYDAYGEVTYTDDDGTYQLLLAFQNDRFTPQSECTEQAELEGEYRIPSRLFINHVDTGANAGQMFLQKVAWVSSELIQPEDTPSPMVCSQPAYNSAAPDAALISLVDYTGRSGGAELVWTIRMSCGDTIRLRQRLTVEPIETFDYHWQDYPMDTIDQLQALVDQVTEEVPLPHVVNLHLPPVTYQGGLTIEGRPINLYGSVGEDGRRTVFTDTVRVAAQDGPILYFYDLDFVGGGDGVGVSASARFWAENCTFTGWKTGVLGYGYAWVNVIGCTFEDNEVGFHFNSDGGNVSHTMFNDNTFLNNGTAVVLERVPTDVALNFQGSYFAGNGTDIDNRCGQAVDIAQAVFE